MIVGIDEVGRGALAGPLCIAAVGLGEAGIAGLTDSKKLTAKKREAFTIEIKQKAPLVGIGWVSAREIDNVGMSKALKLAASRAFAQIDCPEVTQIIIDGTIMLIDDSRATTMKQADLLVPSVSAASIVAKVTRDRYMHVVDTVFPGYGFGSNVGYGTASHLQHINDEGPSPIHRMSFAPMNTGAAPIQRTPVKHGSGHAAESVMATHLKAKGYEILERNWKTKWCEIDLIARKGNTVHFIEVKYRRSDAHGDGLAAVTPKKQRQMAFAAELWLTQRPQYEAVLSVASLSGDSFRVDNFFDLIV